MLVVLQVSERIAGAMHASQLGLVPPKLNEEQSQLLWLQPSPGLGAGGQRERRGMRENT